MVATCVIKWIRDIRGLHSEQNEESDHQTEKAHGFGQGESQDGVGEQLLLQGWVPGKTTKTGEEKQTPGKSCVSTFAA